MNRVVPACLLCCLVAVSIGCGGSSPVAPPIAPPPFETLYKGCGLRASPSLPGLSWAVDNQADLDSQWVEYSLDGSAPTIDFDTRLILASITPGYCRSCCSIPFDEACPNQDCPDGYDAEIVSVTLNESCVEVRVEQIEPVLYLFCNFTYARAHIVSIPKPSLPICFEVNVSVCPEP